MLQINNREREELLHFACKNGQISLIRNLLKDNVDINALNAKGLSPLHLAVIEGNIEVTKLLISEGANIEVTDSKWGSSPLLYACQNGRTKIVKLLVEMGADIEAKSDDDTSAIHFAAQSGKSDLIDFLLQNGLDINCRKKLFKETPLHFLLDNYMAKIPSLYEKTKLLIERGAMIDAETSFKETPLTCAITANNLDVVRLLISCGANVNHKGYYDETPLKLAVSLKRDKEIIKLLINKGADINAAMRTKTTALHSTACQKKACEGVRILFENGANLELQNENGQTAFDLALWHRNTQFVKMALEFYPSFLNLLNDWRHFPVESTLTYNDHSTFKTIISHCHNTMR